MKKIITWILIADGARARLLFRPKAVGGYVEVMETDFIADKRPTRELGVERPGRTHESSGETRHALQPSSDPHREAKRHLAHRVSEFLEEQRQKNAFERLVVIAAPQALGDLRDQFTPPLKTMIVEEISKDLTMYTLHELQGKLADLIEISH